MTLQTGHEASGIEDILRIEAPLEFTHALEAVGEFAPHVEMRATGMVPGDHDCARFIVVQRIVEHFDLRTERV